MKKTRRKRRSQKPALSNLPADHEMLAKFRKEGLRESGTALTFDPAYQTLIADMPEERLRDTGNNKD